ncbi:MAG: glycosyltransferase family 4 protein [Gammaproteobacteria bacterium]|nr:glycosyltransferase family 4 protein [Gammaproteobacteria bacterium]
MLSIVQIVRKFGVNGGMERYVWELSHALADLGVQVHVLCEQSDQNTNHENIRIHYLKRVLPKPRWLAMLRFSSNVSTWVKNNTEKDWVIHSHERTAVHHISTFHGPPFAHVYHKPWYKRISVRVAVWLFLERRELCADNVKAILPNSDLILNDLRNMYPCVRQLLHLPAYPGVNKPIKIIKTQSDKKIILFVGKEWKRKGLVKAVKIVRRLRKRDVKIELWVVGPDKNDVKHLFKDWDSGFKLLGWQDASKFMPSASLLLHPAIAEPYGMAIAEATNYGTPVVVSDQCGIAPQVSSHSGSVVDVEASVDEWIDFCLVEVNRKAEVLGIGKSWKELAQQHIKIYKQLL